MAEVDYSRPAFDKDWHGVKKEVIEAGEQVSAGLPSRPLNGNGNLVAPSNGAAEDLFHESDSEPTTLPGDKTERRGNHASSVSVGLKEASGVLAAQGTSSRGKPEQVSMKKKKKKIQRSNNQIGGKDVTPTVQGNIGTSGTSKGAKEGHGPAGAILGGKGAAPVAVFKKPLSLAGAFEALQASPMPRGKVQARAQTGQARPQAGGANSPAASSPAAVAAAPPRVVPSGGGQAAEARTQAPPAKRAATSDAARLAKLNMGQFPEYGSAPERSRKQKTPPASKAAKKQKTSGRAPLLGGSMSQGTPGLLPDDLRCKRNDGKDWRCRNQRLMDLAFCVHHASRVKVLSTDEGTAQPSPKKRPRSDDKAAPKTPLSSNRKPAKTRKISPVAVGASSSGAGVRGSSEGVAGPRRGRMTSGLSQSARRNVKAEIGGAALPEGNSRETAAAEPGASAAEDSASEAAEEAAERSASADASVQTEEEMLWPFREAQADVVEALPGTAVHGKRKLYWGAGDCWCWRVLLTLEEKGLEYESVLLDLAKREQQDGDVAVLNPRAQVPTLVDGAVVVCDSGAACQYLDWAYPKPRSASRPAGDRRLIPDGATARSQVLQRMYESNCLEAAHRDAVSCFAMAEEDDGQPRGEEWEEKKSRLKDELKLWDSYLQGENVYLVGKELTLADVFFFPFLATSVRWGLDLQKAGFPSLAEYHQRMAQRESVKKTWPAHWHDSEGTPALADVV